jgi:uncharacterized protein YybS (DUF2232 family)
VVSTATDARERSDPRPWGAAGAALVCTLLYAALPLAREVGLFIAMVSPFPLAIQRLRGVGPALVTLVASCLLIGSLFGPGSAFQFAIFLAAPSWLIGEAMVRGHGMRRGCVWAFILVSLEIALLLLASGPELSDQIRRETTASISGYIQQVQPSVSREQLEQLSEQARSFVAALAIVYPAAFIIMGGLCVLMNAVLVRGYLARRDPAWLDGSEFEGLRWPFWIAMAFVLSGATVVLPPLRSAGYNVLLVLAFLFVLQGLAVVLYFAHRLAGPPLLRIAVVVLVLVNPWAPQLLGLLGLFDLWFDFRRFADIPEPPK